MPHRAWIPAWKTLAEFSKFNAAERGQGGQKGRDFLYVWKKGLEERVGLVSLGIKSGDQSHRRLQEPVGISESPRRASAPVFRCIEKEAGVLTRGDGPEVR